MLTLDDNLQVRLPDALCRHGWKPGQQLEAVDVGRGIVIRPAGPDQPPADPEEVRSALDRLGAVAAYTGPTIPVEQMSIMAIPYSDLYPDGP